MLDGQTAAQAGTKRPLTPTPEATTHRSISGQPLRRVAAIDIGTNSTHLLVASVDTTLRTFRIDQAEKSTTRLGERDPDSGALTEAAMQRGYETLRRFRDLAASHEVEQVVTAATSAVREAPNGRDFLQRIKDGLGMEVDLVSGPEEARLIYLGVLSGMTFGDRPHLLLDIGGGSTELILADGRDARALTSTRVGAVRLSVSSGVHPGVAGTRRRQGSPPHQARRDPRVGGNQWNRHGDRCPCRQRG
jgi:exopolyphosphatase/guanosine-5'-triphosphate,3'-diphosphate pyrophosphatase